MDRFSRYDIPYIRLTDFMAAIGKKPAAKQGDRLIYNAPYNIESLYRAYGIETMGKPTCSVNPDANKWEDTEWGAYARGDLYSLAREICNFTKDREIVERYIIDVLTDYNREHAVSLMPMPSVRIINEGGVSVMDIRPKEIDINEFVRQIGYRQVHCDGEWQIFSAPVGQKSYPDIIVNTRQNKWYDCNSSDSGDVYALASRLIGEEAPSEALWFVASVLAGKVVNEVREPWGNRVDNSQKAAHGIQTRPNPKRGKHL